MSVLPPLPERLARIASAAFPPEPTDSPSLRWAILGAGGIARKFARDVKRAGSAVVAVGSRTPARAEAFAVENDIAFHGSYKDVLSRDDVDAVYVATTHNFHLEGALEAIAAGKPVLIEKPIVRNSAELQRLRAAAEEANVLVMEAMWSRFLPHYAIIRALLASGELGGVRYMRAEFNANLRGVERLENPELAGGAALDLGVYSVSFIHWVLGTPRAVTARGRLTDRGVDAQAVAMLDYPEAYAVYESSMDMATANAALISCEKGWIELPVNFYRPSELRVVWDEVPDKAKPYEKYEENWSSQSLAANGFEYQAAAFARALRAGLTEVPGHGWDEAAAVIATLDTIRQQVGVVFPGE
ncbi:MAG: Gfo/Idh/MocA family oxidoreductase [Ancrocorticia sp.]